MARGGQTRGPKASAAAPPRGLQFPRGAAGDRNSTEAVKAALAAATRAGDGAAAERVLAERNWRYGYSAHLVKNCALLAAGPSEAAAISAAGLSALHTTFEYVDRHGDVQTLAGAMAKVPGLIENAGGFDVGVVVGAQAGSPAGPLRVPYQGRHLAGAELKEQLQRWADRGILEADAVRAIGGVSERGAVDLAGRHFVCMGASSEMGPTGALLAHGATVYAIDVPRPAVWQRLVGLAAASRGTLVAPLRRPDAAAGGAAAPAGGPRRRVLGQDLNQDEFCKAAGCNILEETPEAAAWICAQAPGERLCVGTYVYMDGANFVRVALAADAVIQAVCAARPDVALACISSPTECYALPTEAFAEAARRLALPPAGRVHRLWYAPLRAASGGKYCVPVAPAAEVATSEGTLLLRDSYTHMQGPNYAFAKQIQRWRMLLARSQGHVVSVNLGPMTLTRSILSNALIGAGVRGAVHFGLEPFYAATSSALLSALLVHDLSDGASAANPEVPLASPLLLFSENALHVGSWHAAFATNSFTEVCALTYAAGKAQPYVVAGAAALAGAAAWRRRSKL